MSLVVAGVLANESLQRDRRFLERLAADPTLDLVALVERVFLYLDTPHADILARIATRIGTLARDAGVLAADEPPFHADGTLHDALLAIIPGRFARYLTLAPHDDAVPMPLLDERPNIHLSTELPPRINRRLDHHFCPAFSAFRAERQRLYVGPQGFAVFDGKTGKALRAATSRPFSRALLDVEPALLTAVPVLVQDIFNGFNFSHFLFDWMARANVFATSPYFDPKRHVFVFGGIPTLFHHIVIEGFKAAFGLTELNIFFPTEPVVFECPNGVVFFSDNFQVSAHPAQMCRSETIELLRHLVQAAPVARPPGTRRIYISRGDSGRRMLRNEGALFAALEQLGFEAVRMADHPMEKQIAMICGAECIVGAHGMGLTHMAFHPGRPRVVELFNPEVGTDTYAFPAKALGFEYHPVVGMGVEGSEDFTIDVQAVMAALEGLPERGRMTEAGVSRRLASDMPRWSGGVQRTKATETQPEMPDTPDAPVFRHVREVELEDTNVGWWHVTNLRPGQIYRLSCQVLIPADFAGERVFLSASNWTSVNADLSIRDRWQRLVLTRTCPEGNGEVDLVLRVISPTDTSCLSAGWEVTSSVL